MNQCLSLHIATNNSGEFFMIPRQLFKTLMNNSFKFMCLIFKRVPHALQFLYCAMMHAAQKVFAFFNSSYTAINILLTILLTLNILFQKQSKRIVNFETTLIH